MEDHWYQAMVTKKLKALKWLEKMVPHIADCRARNNLEASDATIAECLRKKRIKLRNRTSKWREHHVSDILSCDTLHEHGRPSNDDAQNVDAMQAVQRYGHGVITTYRHFDRTEGGRKWEDRIHDRIHVWIWKHLQVEIETPEDAVDAMHEHLTARFRDVAQRLRTGCYFS